MCHIEMLPADQPAAPDKKYLNHCLVLVLRHGNNIFIFPVRIGHFLFLGYGFHTFQQFPIGDSFFELHIF